LTIISFELAAVLHLGGSVASADLLFAEISQNLGREMASATIFRAPTIATLASLLDQPELPWFSPFVQLKAGGQKTPIVIAHGLDGRASFSGLAKRIQTDHPVYGIQAKGLMGWSRHWTALRTWPSSILMRSANCNPTALTF
jgi:hypothetical protein